MVNIGWPHCCPKLVEIWVLAIHLTTRSYSGWVLMTNIFLESKNMDHQLFNALSTMFLRRLDIFLHFETYVLQNSQNPYFCHFPIYQLDFLPQIYNTWFDFKCNHVHSISRFLTKIPPFYYVDADMEYGFYTAPNRITADQVPWQNMQVTHTIDLIGATSVHIKKWLGDAKQRFCTLQVTGRAVNPQNVPLNFFT